MLGWYSIVVTFYFILGFYSNTLYFCTISQLLEIVFPIQAFFLSHSSFSLKCPFSGASVYLRLEKEKKERGGETMEEEERRKV